jgi:hypothetical protein
VSWPLSPLTVNIQGNRVLFSSTPAFRTTPQRDHTRHRACPCRYGGRELYLKALVQPQKRNHDLGYLLELLEKLLKDHHTTEMPAWFHSLLSEFAEYDPRSTTFRYPGLIYTPEERLVELPQLHRQMDILFQTFHRIYIAEMDYKRKSS